MARALIGYFDLVLTLLVMTWAINLADSATVDVRDIQYDYAVGDPRRCIQQAQQTNMNLNRYGVLPGSGWDNLQNEGMGIVVKFSYSKCKITDSGLFLIPDTVDVVPLKTSHVETFAEFITSYLQTTSSTSHSINVQMSGSAKKFVASGSFSADHQIIKSKQIEGDSVTTRVQLRYHRYEAHLKPQPELDPQFKERCLSIANNLLLNNTEQALYDGQLLVRDYGTHVQTSVTAGAGLVKTDFIKKSYVAANASERTNILAHASGSFLEKFNLLKFEVGGSRETMTSTAKKYSQSMTHSYVTVQGGGVMGTKTSSVDDWVNSVESNLVAMDRAGDPLNFLITEKLFPELTKPVLAKLEKVVRDSIELYYEMNTIRGCADMESPKFEPAANVDDKTCDGAGTNFTFGGVYRTCRKDGDPCYAEIPEEEANPITGGASCPTGYSPVEIFSTTTKTYHTKEKCEDCYIFFDCCDDVGYYITTIKKTYWCSAAGTVGKKSGYIFGGVYTTQQGNIITAAKSCPEHFFYRKLYADLFICMSDQYNGVTGLTFGGLFTCRTGNPLAAPGRYRWVNFQNKWPKKCPLGYSQYLAAMIKGCAIHYCIKSPKTSNSPPLKRPPFSLPPMAFMPEEDETIEIVNTPQAQTSLEHEEDEQAPLNSTENPAKKPSKEQPKGMIIGVSVVAAVVIMVVTALALLVRRCHKSYSFGNKKSGAEGGAGSDAEGGAAPDAKIDV